MKIVVSFYNAYHIGYLWYWLCTSCVVMDVNDWTHLYLKKFEAFYSLRWLWESGLLILEFYLYPTLFYNWSNIHLKNLKYLMENIQVCIVTVNKNTLVVYLVRLSFLPQNVCPCTSSVCYSTIQYHTDYFVPSAKVFCVIVLSFIIPLYVLFITRAAPESLFGEAQTKASRGTLIFFFIPQKFPYRKALSRGAYGHDPFWSVFEEHRLDSTTTDIYYNGTIYIMDNVIVLSDLVESSGYSSKGSCPYAPLDEVLRYGRKGIPVHALRLWVKWQAPPKMAPTPTPNTAHTSSHL